MALTSCPATLSHRNQAGTNTQEERKYCDRKSLWKYKKKDIRCEESHNHLMFHKKRGFSFLLSGRFKKFICFAIACSNYFQTLTLWARFCPHELKSKIFSWEDALLSIFVIFVIHGHSLWHWSHLWIGDIYWFMVINIRVAFGAITSVVVYSWFL